MQYAASLVHARGRLVRHRKLACGSNGIRESGKLRRVRLILFP